MRALILQVAQPVSPEVLLEQLRAEPGLVVLRSSLLGLARARYSFVAARPFLRFQSFGSRCEIRWEGGQEICFGDPWRLLERLLCRFELSDELDLPFPLGGCFGFWGYDLKNFVEPRLPRRAINDLEFPDCQVGFYDSLVAFDHLLGAAWILSTGLEPDGSRTEARAAQQAEFWKQQLTGQGTSSSLAGHGIKFPSPQLSTQGEEAPKAVTNKRDPGLADRRPNFSQVLLGESRAFAAPERARPRRPGEEAGFNELELDPSTTPLFSNLARTEFLSKVKCAQSYIRAGDIYQVNLSRRLTAPLPVPASELFRSLGDLSPAPFAAYLDAGEFQIVSTSPELFLRLSGAHVQTCPIKGTRPRSADPLRDSQWTYQLRTSEKEMAELVMITDLLRNDLGKVCEFGSVVVPELARLDRYPQVQHLVSTIEGTLRKGVTHLEALAACFPGGSITGAPKFRAMEIIDELEPVSRGPYTGALGYLGFNRESQLSIIIRAALCKDGFVHFQTGAGIVADSVPEAEYLETLAKARGFIEALQFCLRRHDCFSQRPVRS